MIASHAPEAYPKSLSEKRTKVPAGIIVGIGSSAGGLSALKKLVKALKHDRPFGVIIVQHISPEFECFLPEILSNHSGKRVEFAKSGDVVREGDILLCPPGQLIQILNNRICCEEWNDHKNSSFFPIDRLFTSLAQDYGNKSVGVILSGAGSDGAIGAQKLFENNGLTIVQNPKEARFSSMPQAAIQSGFAKEILEIKQIENCISRFCEICAETDKCADSNHTISKQTLDSLGAASGFDFHRFKNDDLHQALSFIASEEQADSVPTLTSRAHKDAQFAKIVCEKLFNWNSCNELSSLELEPLIQNLIAAKASASKTKKPLIKVWIIDGSNGKASLNLSKDLFTLRKKHNLSFEYKVISSKLHGSTSLLPRLKTTTLAEMNKEEAAFIKKRILFANHSFFDNTPFLGNDFVFCGNLLTHLKSSFRASALFTLQASLNTEGYVVTESILPPLEQSECRFSKVSNENFVYKRLQNEANNRSGATSNSASMAQKNLLLEADLHKAKTEHSISQSHLQQEIFELQKKHNELMNRFDLLKDESSSLRSTNKELVLANEQLYAMNREVNTRVHEQTFLNQCSAESKLEK